MSASSKSVGITSPMRSNSVANNAERTTSGGKLPVSNPRASAQISVDAQMLKEIAQVAQGKTPSEGMEAIMAYLAQKNIDPATLGLSRGGSKGNLETLLGVHTARENVKNDHKKDEPKKVAVDTRKTEHAEPKKEEKPEIVFKPKVDRTKRQSGVVTKQKIVEADHDKRAKLDAARAWEATEFDDTKKLSSFPTKSWPGLIPYSGFSVEHFRYLFNLSAKFGANPVPEVVLVGPHSVGKSSVCEALVGIANNLVGFKQGGKTKRTIIYNFISNELYSSPRITVSVAGGKFEEVSLAALGAEILKHNPQHFEPEPIQINYEWKECFNFRVYDTCGLPADQEHDEFALISQYLLELMRPSNRLVVVVDEFVDKFPDNYSSQYMQVLARKVDPASKRTVFAFNKLLTTADRTTNPQFMNKLLTGLFSETAFFFTLPSTKERDAALKENKYTDRLAQCEARDRDILAKLSVPSRFHPHIGVLSLRQHVLTWCWKFLTQTIIPPLFKKLDAKKKEISGKMQQVEKQLSGVNLRNIGANYATLYLETVDAVLVGTCLGNPSSSGKTLKEELDEQYFAASEWNPSGNVPFESQKLYGGQQLERILSEFRDIVDHMELPNSALRDLPSPSEKMYFFNLVEICQEKVESVLIPVIEQLVERVTYVFKQITYIVESIMEKKSFTLRTQSGIEYKHFGPLNTFLKDNFSTFVDRISKNAKTLMMEEFYPTKTLHWHMKRLHPEVATEDPTKLAMGVFHSIKSRVKTNVLRKFYNFFLVPFVKTDLQIDLQHHLLKLETPSLNEVFEYHNFEDYLDNQLENLEVELEKLYDSEGTAQKIVASLQ